MSSQNDKYGHVFYDYPPEARAALEEVARLQQALFEAADAGRALGAVVDYLDPDVLHVLHLSESGRAEVIRERVREAWKLLESAPLINNFSRVSSRTVLASRWGTSPTIAAFGDGRLLISWLEWHEGVGEQVAATVLRDREVEVPASILSGPPTDCYRPTAAIDSNGCGWIFYGSSVAGRTSVWCSRLESPGQWSEPEPVSPVGDLGFNQGVTAHGDGRIECCWQGEVNGRFVIFSRTWRAGRWGEIHRISDPVPNVWDPDVAALSDGSTFYVWTQYQGGSYGLASRVAGNLGFAPQRDLVTGSNYALHPRLAVGPDDAVWLAFDLLTIQGHGGSGSTRLRPATQIGESSLPHDSTDVVNRIRVVKVDSDGLIEPVERLGAGLEVHPVGMPTISALPDGGLVVAYRVLRRLPLSLYYWEVVAQHLGLGGWSGPATFQDSDGGPAEPAIATDGSQAVIAWQSDGRRRRCLQWTQDYGGRETSALSRHTGDAQWETMDGPSQVFVGRMGGEGPAHVVERSTVVDSLPGAEARPWLQRGSTGRYRTTLRGSAYNLYWGDLHRHSVVSRCAMGAEPTIDDYHKFSRDVSEYDFWALTDHAEHTSRYHWWTTQKLADLLRRDGHFVPLYGFEWTSGKFGHQNVIYGDVPRGAPIFSAFATGSRTPTELWSRLREHQDLQVITIPHHPGSSDMPYDWHHHDEEFVRVVEIFQACRGNYESDGCFRQYADALPPGESVVSGLRRGYRFGLIASTDHLYGSSYVGAYARSLDREEVFRAITDRRVIGATTRDIAIDFRINNGFIGEEITEHGPLSLSAKARGYADIARIDVVSEGHVAFCHKPRLDLPQTWVACPVRVEWRWRTACQALDWSGHLNVREGEVLQTAYWSPEVRDVATNSIAWSAQRVRVENHSTPLRGGIECTVVGPPEALVEVETPSGSLGGRLGALVKGEWPSMTVDGRGEIRLQPGIGGLLSLGERETALDWASNPTHSTWYYLRVFLVDGEMAWSSPIWVDRSE